MKKLCRTEYNKTNDSHNNIHYYVDTVDIPAAHTCHAIGVNKKNKDSPRITYKEIRIFCETDLLSSSIVAGKSSGRSSKVPSRAKRLVRGPGF